MKKKTYALKNIFNHSPYSSPARVIVQHTHSVLPHYVARSMWNFINNTLQLDGASNAIEFLWRRDSSVVVDRNEWHYAYVK